MKKIILLGAAQIDGAWRYPSEGEIEVAPTEAADLIEVGLAKEANLKNRTLEELHEIALAESVDFGPDATKAELIEAIQQRRRGAPAE